MRKERLLLMLGLLLGVLFAPREGLSAPGTPYKAVVNNSGRAQPVLDGATGQPIYIGNRPWLIAPGEYLLSHAWGDSPRFVYRGQSYHYVGSVGSSFRFFVVPDWGTETTPSQRGSGTPVPNTLVLNDTGRPLPVLDGATGQPIYIGNQPWTVDLGQTILSYHWGESPRFTYQGRSYHYIGSVGGGPFRFFVVEDWSGQPVSLRPPAGSVLLREHAAKITNLANEERLRAGLPPLRPQIALITAAKSYAALLVNHNWFDHTGPDGSTPPVRMEAAGYRGWRAWGENLAKDYPLSSPESIVKGWMESPRHRRIILDPVFEETGVGCYPLAGGTKVLCVQMFGAR